MPFGDVPGIGELGEITELFGRRDGRRSPSTSDPRAAGVDGAPPRKRNSFFRDLLEGFGE